MWDSVGVCVGVGVSVCVGVGVSVDREWDGVTKVYHKNIYNSVL